MDWFEELFGFREGAYEFTREQLAVDGETLRSRVNGRSFGIGKLELVSLDSLRERVRSRSSVPGRLKVSVTSGDVRKMHQEGQYEGALFQVASQFNLLEMVGPDVTPEHGVTRYRGDPTQGPACAMAAGAATVYRNYFAPVGADFGQTRDRQLNGLAQLGQALSELLAVPVEKLWEMRNGYALCTEQGLNSINRLLESADAAGCDDLRGKLCIGVHRDVEVTDAKRKINPAVTQAFCSALPVSYSAVPRIHWKGFATLVLEAAYEATLLTAADRAAIGQSNMVLLTRLGGGAFGNDDEWIYSAMRRALRKVADVGLDVRLVSYGTPSSAMMELAGEFAQ